MHSTAGINNMKKAIKHILAWMLTTAACYSCSSGARKQDPSVAAEPQQQAGPRADAHAPCDHPNMTLSLEGREDRSFCSGSAQVMLHSLFITGESERYVHSVIFSPGSRDSVTAGRYQATLWKKPKGQRSQVMVTVAERMKPEAPSYSMAEGYVDLEIADGERFKGTFNGTAKNTKNQQEQLRMTGAFDVKFDASKNVKDFDALDSIVKAESHGKKDLKETIRREAKENKLE